MKKNPLDYKIICMTEPDDIPKSEYANRKDVILSIPRADVENKDFGWLNRHISHWESNPFRVRGKVMLTFDGYNDDPREIYQIQEIRDFVILLFTEHPNLLYFIHPKFINVILFCMLSFKAIPNNNPNKPDSLEFDYSDSQNKKLINILLCETLNFAKKINDNVDYCCENIVKSTYISNFLNWERAHEQ